MYKHTTKLLFRLIMDISFFISKLFPPKFRGVKSSITTFPKTIQEIRAKYREWKYDFDPGRGVWNTVPSPHLAKEWTVDDCDGYAASLYGLCPHKEKYLLTYFTKDMTKWHTVFVWVEDGDSTKKAHCINWSRYYGGTLSDVLNQLKDYSRSPWYDYHLAVFDDKKNKWKTHK